MRLATWITALAAALLCTASGAHAASASLSWTPPDQNTDGTPLTDLAGYRVYAGCNQSGTYELEPVAINDPGITSWVYEGLPNGTTCYFTSTAVNSAGVESAYSNEAQKVTPALDEPLPGPVEDLRVEWQESGGVVAFTHTGSASNNAKSATATTGTHGITINDGDLVVVYINANNSGAIAPSASGQGAAWTEAVDETPSGETAQQALYWKEAGASEPSEYTFDLGSSRDYWIGIMVFSAASNFVVDAAANTARSGSGKASIYCDAYANQVISDNAVAVVFGGKDNRHASGEAYTTADNSYTGVIGTANANQMGAGAYRIYTTGETVGAGAAVDIDTADASDPVTDFVYSVHMSFVESAGGASIVLNPARQFQHMMVR